MSEIPRSDDALRYERSGHGVSTVLGWIASVLPSITKKEDNKEDDAAETRQNQDKMI